MRQMPCWSEAGFCWSSDKRFGYVETGLGLWWMWRAFGFVQRWFSGFNAVTNFLLDYWHMCRQQHKTNTFHSKPSAFQDLPFAPTRTTCSILLLWPHQSAKMSAPSSCTADFKMEKSTYAKGAQTHGKGHMDEQANKERKKDRQKERKNKKKKKKTEIKKK